MKKTLIAALVCASAFGQAQGLLNNLTGCYPLDCSAANNASTGTQYNGTIGGSGVTCTNNRFSVANMAMQFNPGSSNDKIFFYSTGFISGAQTVSGSLWIMNGMNGNQEIIYQAGGCSASESFALRVMATGQGAVLQISRIGNPCGTPVTVSVQSGLIGSAWRHVVFCMTTTSLALVVDNTLYSTTHASMPISWGGNAPIILGGTGSGANTYTGRIDDLRFYDRTLTANEITDLFTNNPSCAASSGTVAPPPPPPAVGNYCSAQLSALTANYQVDLAGFNYNFTTGQNSQGKVLIGKTACATNSSARLHVEDDNMGNAIFGQSSTSSSGNIGVKGLAMEQNPGNSSFGVLGEAWGPNYVNKGKLAGVAGFCTNWNSSAMPQGRSIGVYGNGLNGGVYAGYFDGDVTFNGFVLGSQFNWVGSDRRFKTNIKELENVSEKIMNLKAYTYNLNREEFKNKNFPERQQIGFIAQELKELFPQLVTEDQDGYLAVSYEGFIPVLLQAHKEQVVENKKQQQQIDELKALIQASSTTGLSVTLGDNTTIVLNQNVPNPFAERTAITYNIPTDFHKAEIIFTTGEGTIIKTVMITEKGPGSLTVFANDLSHGIYTYTLVVDGKSVDSKKMVKE